MMERVNSGSEIVHLFDFIQPRGLSGNISMCVKLNEGVCLVVVVVVGEGVYVIVPAAQTSLLSRRTPERLLNDLPVLVR